MSWKKIATVAVCALMATQAWAGPSLHLANTGLNAAGNWVWELRANPDPAQFTSQTQGTGGSLALELGLQTSQGSILSITPNPAGSGTIPNTTTGNASSPVEFINPGNVIFGWETLTDISQAQNGSNMKPVGIQIGAGGNSNQAFLALGTTFFTSAAGSNGYLIANIVTTGPDSDQVGNLVTTNLQVVGRYDGNGFLLGSPNPATGKGVLAQSISSTNALVYDDYAGNATRSVRDGNANFTVDNVVDVLDLDILGQNYNQSGKIWTQADFNRDGIVDILDLDVMGQNYNQSGGANTVYSFQASGAGAGVTAVPEPASIALVAMALMACAAMARRN